MIISINAQKVFEQIQPTYDKKSANQKLKVTSEK